jgi:hypothetical protein
MYERVLQSLVARLLGSDRQSVVARRRTQPGDRATKDCNTRAYIAIDAISAVLVVILLDRADPAAGTNTRRMRRARSLSLRTGRRRQKCRTGLWTRRTFSRGFPAQEQRPVRMLTETGPSVANGR